MPLPGYEWLRRNLSGLNSQGGDELARNRNLVIGGAVWALSAVLMVAWVVFLVAALISRGAMRAVRRARRRDRERTG